MPDDDRTYGYMKGGRLEYPLRSHVKINTAKGIIKQADYNSHPFLLRTTTEAAPCDWLPDPKDKFFKQLPADNGDIIIRPITEMEILRAAGDERANFDLVEMQDMVLRAVENLRSNGFTGFTSMAVKPYAICDVGQVLAANHYANGIDDVVHAAVFSLTEGDEREVEALVNDTIEDPQWVAVTYSGSAPTPLERQVQAYTPAGRRKYDFVHVSILSYVKTLQLGKVISPDDIEEIDATSERVARERHFSPDHGYRFPVSPIRGWEQWLAHRAGSCSHG